MVGQYRDKKLYTLLSKLTYKPQGTRFQLPVAFYVDLNKKGDFTKQYFTIDVAELHSDTSNGEYYAILSNNTITDYIIRDRNESFLCKIKPKLHKHIVTAIVRGYSHNEFVLTTICPMFTPVIDLNSPTHPSSLQTAENYFYTNGFQESYETLKTLVDSVDSKKKAFRDYINDITNWVIVNGEHKLLII